MSTFELIAKVIKRIRRRLEDEGLDGIPEKMQEKLRYLSGGYARLHGSNSHAIDYSNGVTQLCYVFKYVAAHADYLFKVLRRARSAAAAPLFSGKTLRVACLGGGPGSDIIGIMRYLEHHRSGEPTSQVIVDIYDKEEAWLPVLKDIVGEITSDISLDVTFVALDVSDASTWDTADFSKYDLITASFFVSEIRRIGLGQPAKRFWKYVLGTIADGAIVAFNDNNDERIYGYFDAIAKGSGAMETVASAEDEEVSCSDSFYPIERLIEKLDHRPKRNGHTAYRVIRKAEL